MTTNNKTLALSGSALALSIMLVAGLSFASAHEGRNWNGPSAENRMSEEQVLESKADFFNITPESLKERLDLGETYRDVAESLGYTKEEMRDQMREKASAHIEELLSDGIITEARAAEILEKIDSNEHRREKGGFHGGFHKNFDEGFGKGNIGNN